jgi:hypothetical protein
MPIALKTNYIVENGEKQVDSVGDKVCHGTATERQHWDIGVLAAYAVGLLILASFTLRRGASR